MRGRRAEIEAAGARLVFVGNGSVAHARRFREKHVPESEVYTDPELTAYTARLRVAPLEEAIAQVRPDEAGGAGDHRAHQARPMPR